VVITSPYLLPLLLLFLLHVFVRSAVVHPIIRFAKMPFGTELKPDVLKTKGQRVTTLITIVGWPDIRINGLYNIYNMYINTYIYIYIYIHHIYIVEVILL